MTGDNNTCWAEMPRLIESVCEAGQRLHMPFIAAQGDLGDPDPMADENGVPYAETHFKWIDPHHHYWRDRKLALSLTLLTAARVIAEPFYYKEGRFHSWRETRLLDAIDTTQVGLYSQFREAVIAPVHLPRGVIGAVVWCANEPVDVAERFAREAEHLHALAYRFIATHCEARARGPRMSQIPQALTRREVQCLRWAAAGKTDGEIGIILSLSVSTVRFHLRNAGAKLSTSGRAQAIQAAAGYGFIGGRVN